MRYDQMFDAAMKQAKERANREGEDCYIYHDDDRWYVRTQAEGEPKGAVLVAKASPEQDQANA